MHTLLMMLGGFVVWAAAWRGKMASASAIHDHRHRHSSAMVLGCVCQPGSVMQAGCSFMEELPIFLVIFGLPVAAAGQWKCL